MVKGSILTTETGQGQWEEAARGAMQVDFVGHAQNPHFKRGLPRGEAARLAAPLMNLRVERKAEDAHM